MRTIISLPEALAEAEAAKARARTEGRTFTSLVEEGLRAVLAAGPPRGTTALPTYGDPRDRPLVDLHDRDAVWAALDADGPA